MCRFTIYSNNFIGEEKQSSCQVVTQTGLLQEINYSNSVIVLNSVTGTRGWKVGNIIIKPPMLDLEKQRPLPSMSGVYPPPLMLGSVLA